MIIISTIVCTYKRADYLRAALESLCHQTLPVDKYEIVVVDNACEPAVERIVNEFKNQNVNLRYVTEKHVGLSRARNKGLKEARGRYVAYMDDDARAGDRWLEGFVRAFENTTPPPVAIGGRVWLDWDGEKPAWVPNEQLSLFTFVDHGEEGHTLRDGEYLVGANLAFDRAALIAIGGFDANLGRQGRVLLSGEEAHALQTFLDRGLSVYYEPSAVVWHSVHPSRKRPLWLLRRMFWDGASQPLVDRSPQQLTRRSILLGVCYDLRQCASWSARAVTASIRGRKNTAWQSLLGLSQRAGRLRTQVRMLAWTD